MPILGANVPEGLVRQTRDALLTGINTSSVLRDLLGYDLKFLLTRQTYTGDYVLRGQRGSKFFLIARFAMLPMPGCKGVCIFHHAEVEEALRGAGIGKELLRIRIRAARDLGYSMILATVRADNSQEIKMLQDAGFDTDCKFLNKRTGNHVILFRKGLVIVLNKVG